MLYINTNKIHVYSVLLWIISCFIPHTDISGKAKTVPISILSINRTSQKTERNARNESILRKITKVI